MGLPLSPHFLPLFTTFHHLDSFYTTFLCIARGFFKNFIAYIKFISHAQLYLGTDGNIMSVGPFIAIIFTYTNRLWVYAQNLHLRTHISVNLWVLQGRMLIYTQSFQKGSNFSLKMGLRTKNFSIGPTKAHKYIRT